MPHKNRCCAPTVPPMAASKYPDRPPQRTSLPRLVVGGQLCWMNYSTNTAIRLIGCSQETCLEFSRLEEDVEGSLGFLYPFAYLM